MRTNTNLSAAVDGLLTVREAAEVLRLTTETVYRRIADCELEVLRLGSGPKAPIRIDPEEIGRYVARMSVRP